MPLAAAVSGGGGEGASGVGVNVEAGETRAPGYLTEAELLGLMERHGIGTDASIAAHVANVQARNYVRLGRGRTLVPTELGAVLAHGYHRSDPELSLPKVRAAIESQCALIAAGRADAGAVGQRSAAAPAAPAPARREERLRRRGRRSAARVSWASWT